MLSFKQVMTNYNAVHFDFDGTLADTNLIKKNAIHSAVKSVTGNQSSAKQFADWFIEKSGVAREEKVSSYFTPHIGEKILSEYETFLEHSLDSVRVEEDAISFVERLRDHNIYTSIVSGGDRSEILKILKASNCATLFETILGPPTSKTIHLRTLRDEIKGRALYFGDSPVDAMASLDCGMDFCFVQRFACVSLSKIPDYTFTIPYFSKVS